MAGLSLASFVTGVVESRLLDEEQCAEVRRLTAGARDPRELASELIRRDWLTVFQINQIYQGKGAGLNLGPYVLLQRLGEGGMGQVYKARHKTLHRAVALKVIRKECLDNPRVRQRFRREIRAVSRLDHPNIVRALDASQVDGAGYFAMEYIDGVDLAKLVKNQGPLPVAQACEYIRQAALGLQHAFERGLVHRDIKPANLLVTQTSAVERRRSSAKLARPSLDKKKSSGRVPGGEPMMASPWGVVKILDMGLARYRDPATGESMTHLTQIGTVMGTPDFIAPEQARDASASDIRADLYSLGCTLYYLLTGRVPFPTGTATDKLLQHQFEEPTYVVQARKEQIEKLGRTDIDPRVPTAVVKLLRRLLAKAPELRHQTPMELARELQSIVRGLADGTLPMEDVEQTTVEMPALETPAKKPTRPGPGKQAVKWQPWALLLGALSGVVLLLLFSVLGIVLTFANRARAELKNEPPMNTEKHR